MYDHTNAISNCVFLAFDCRNVFPRRSKVRLGVYVVFNVFEERSKLNVGFNGCDVDGCAIGATEDVVE